MLYSYMYVEGEEWSCGRGEGVRVKVEGGCVGNTRYKHAIAKLNFMCRGQVCTARVEYNTNESFVVCHFPQKFDSCNIQPHICSHKMSH